MTDWNATRDRLLRRFYPNREEHGNGGSTVHCVCGASYTWKDLGGDPLCAWVDEHGPHMPPLPSEPSEPEPSWKTITDAACKLFVAGPWEEANPQSWVRSVIWRPRLDAPCPCIDLDGYTAHVGTLGKCWVGSGDAFPTLEEAKAEEDRRLREDGWILT
jgi:hypothetical protein